MKSYPFSFSKWDYPFFPMSKSPTNFVVSLGISVPLISRISVKLKDNRLKWCCLEVNICTRCHSIFIILHFRKFEELTYLQCIIQGVRIKQSKLKTTKSAKIHFFNSEPHVFIMKMESPLEN